ncbi:glycosyltransferase family 4 protein [Primorskyibacter sp. S87]|uniref:glycosyltransferase family 4 protein n=1 Tax=Primorskyibacter sp. S87 TaxID=3415126 RepID=UPI003C79C5D7
MTTDNSSKQIDVLFIRNIRGLEQPSGGEVYLVNLARALPSAGVRPHFLFAGNRGANHDIILNLFRDAGATFDLCEVPSPLSRIDLKAAKKVIRDRKPDLTHSIDHRGDLIGALLAKDCPPVASFLGWTNFSPGSLRWNVYGAIDRYALKRMEMIFYDSKLMTENLGKLSNSPKLRYVPNGVDPDQFIADRDAFSGDKPLTFIQIARFHPNKGQLDFVRAAHLANKLRPGLKFILVGNAAPEQESYEREVRDYVAANCPDCIEFTGPVPHSALPGLISRADALVAPSFLEGLSYAVLESMSMGRVPICYNTGGLSEALSAGRNGIVVETGDVGALADCFVDLDQDRGKGRALGQAARELVLQKYSPHAMAEGVSAGYREVLERRLSRNN